MTRHLRSGLRILTAWTTLGLIVGCGLFEPQLVEDDDPVTEVPADPSMVEAAEPAAAGGGGACARIEACCRAYVEAMGTVPASTCDGYQNAAAMPESACSQTMAGYRQGLTALGRDVPSACAE